MAARRRAFTLMELLIVVGIIATLLALLLPTAAGVMGRLKAMRCQKRLTTLHTCLRQYLADNGDTFPPMRSMGRNDALIQQMADEAGLTPSDAKNAGGHHWSLFLWPYHRDLDNYVCPDDPRADLRGDLGDGLAMASPFTDAPPESYALNTLLFRYMPKTRQLAGASWGLKSGEYQTELMFTTRNDQLRTIPSLDSRILMCCGAAGFTVGNEWNVVWRDTGLTPTNHRYEWHPYAGPGAFEDAEGYGSNYLFVSGAVEYRENFPSRFEWVLDLK
jgi:prepilin-type N-terminal cleavage/methylation domain-containing protein